MRSKLNASFDECGTSALGIGIPQRIPPKSGPLPKGYPFQVVCHLALLNGSEPLPKLGSAQLLIRISGASFLLSGPAVERAGETAGAAAGDTGASTLALGVAPVPMPSWQLGSCLAIMFGNPKWVGKWMLHQLKLGASGVHMYTYEDSTGLQPMLREAIRNSSAQFELVEWPVPPWTRVGMFKDYAAQDNALSHCIIRNAPKYRWMLVSDTDEYLQFAPQSGSLITLIALREQLWHEVRLNNVDSIDIQRDTVRGTPESSEECEDAFRVLPKSVVNTHRVVRMNPHGPSFIFDAGLHGLRPGQPVNAEVAPTSMRFAHFATGYKGCAEQATKLARGAATRQRAARSSESEQPDDCLAAYAGRLDGIRAGLGTALLAAWGDGNGEEPQPGPAVLVVGAGAAAAEAVAAAAGQGSAGRRRPLPGPGSGLASERGRRFVLRFLGWRGAGELEEGALRACYGALEDLVEGEGAVFEAPRSLLAALGTLPHDPYLLDFGVEVLVSQGPAIDIPDGQLQDAALGDAPAARALLDACGSDVVSFGWEQLSSLHDAFVEAAQCMSPHVSVINVPSTVTQEELSMSLMMPE